VQIAKLKDDKSTRRESVIKICPASSVQSAQTEAEEMKVGAQMTRQAEIRTDWGTMSPEQPRPPASTERLTAGLLYDRHEIDENKT